MITNTIIGSNFRLYDAGEGKRLSGDQRDCQVRALHAATGLTYREAWDFLYRLQGVYRTNGFNLNLYLDHEECGAIRKLKFPAQKGKPRMTAAKFVKSYPKGSFILSQAHHVVAVLDGIVYDKVDSTERCVYGAWQIDAAAINFG
jgi:hypothetical protein